MGHPCPPSLVCASSGDDSPIWSCSVRGFACHPCYHGRGALLPHLFTLTSTKLAAPKRRERSRAVSFLCHYPSGHPDRALPGALPCGVRTFLPPSPSELRNSGYGGRSPGLLQPINSIAAAGLTRLSLGKFGIAQVFCRGCCEGCRSLRRSSKCSSRFREVL